MSDSLENETTLQQGQVTVGSDIKSMKLFCEEQKVKLHIKYPTLRFYTGEMNPQYTGL